MNSGQQSVFEILPSKEMLDSIINAFDTPVFVKDVNGRYLYVNDTFLKISRKNREDVVGKTDYDFVPEEIAEIVLSEDHKVYETKKTHKYSESMYSNGKIYRYLMTKIPLLDAQGNLMGLIGVSQCKEPEEAADTCPRLDIKPATEETPTSDIPLCDGLSYLINEPESAKSLSLFSKCMSAGYQGLVAGRLWHSQLEKHPHLEKSNFLWLGSKMNDVNCVGLEDLDLLVKTIKYFIDNSHRFVILLQDVNLLITANGFDKFLKFLLELNDEILSSKKGILVVSADADTLTYPDYRCLQRQLTEIEEDNMLPDSLHTTLSYVYSQNKGGKKPNYRQLQDGLDISKKTAAQRIEELVRKGLIATESSGRSKLIYVTENGKRLL